MVRGGDFISHALNHFHDEEGVAHMLATPYAHQQHEKHKWRN